MDQIKSHQVIVAAAQYPIDFFKDINEWITKTRNWVQQAVDQNAKLLLFPEYGAMELTSLLVLEEQKNLKVQAQKIVNFLPIFQQLFQQLAQEHQIYIVAPSLPFDQQNKVTNRVFVFSPTGQMDYQDKFYMTRFENEDWSIQSGEPLIKVFETPDFKFAISTCFDVEFSFPAMAAAAAGAQILLAPSCTETIKGASRVHIGARARALENQNYVVVSQTVGEAQWSTAVDLNYGYAAFYATADVGFPDDGIIQQGEPQKPGWLVQALRLTHIEKVRTQGAVFNFATHQKIINMTENLQKTFPIQAKLIKLY